MAPLTQGIKQDAGAACPRIVFFLSVYVPRYMNNRYCPSMQIVKREVEGMGNYTSTEL